MRPPPEERKLARSRPPPPPPPPPRRVLCLRQEPALGYHQALQKEPLQAAPEGTFQNATRRNCPRPRHRALPRRGGPVPLLLVRLLSLPRPGEPASPLLPKSHLRLRKESQANEPGPRIPVGEFPPAMRRAAARASRDGRGEQRLPQRRPSWTQRRRRRSAAPGARPRRVEE